MGDDLIFLSLAPLPKPQKDLWGWHQDTLAVPA